MMEEHSNVLTQRDETIIRAVATIQKASKKAERLISDYRPILNGDRLLTDPEVADLLKVSRRTLQEYRNDGILPYIEMKGKVVYRESDIEQFLRIHYRKGISMSHINNLNIKNL